MRLMRERSRRVWLGAAAGSVLLAVVVVALVWPSGEGAALAAVSGRSWHAC